MGKYLISFGFVYLLYVPAFAQSRKAPKLVVGIVVDQMCYDYLYRFYQRFGKDGFRQIMDFGTNCRNTHYNYVPTYTGPGHASIYTGTTPSNHGIVGNDWFDRKSGESINCVDDFTVQPVGSTSSDGNCSPKNYKTHTVGDQLRMTSKASKVIAVSIKDRGAILPGGHLSNGSYWFDYKTAKFISSSFYCESLPTWVNDFNERNVVEEAMKNTWNTLYPVESYTASNPDNSIYERILPGKTTPTFPYDLSQLKQNIPPTRLFTLTPYANTALTDLAISAISNEQLGQDLQPDMLCISYSTPDIAGHTFGPYAVEIEDMYLRLDQEIARLLKILKKSCGKNGFTLFLTADHAVVPVPQQLVDMNLPGGYFSLVDKLTSLDSAFLIKYKAPIFLKEENLNIYLNHRVIDSLGLNLAAIQQDVAQYISGWEQVKAVYPASELEKLAADNEWKDMLRRGYHKAESGDVLFILEPGYISVDRDEPTEHVGTTHGSAFNYDTHVPLLWYGAGIPKQNIHRKVDITDIAATLIQLLNLQRNGAMTGEPIVELLGH
jgi:predicted AlkP superfamily pyrophosphatase or phosphodiesterase